jgi:hypothetical protein
MATVKKTMKKSAPKKAMMSKKPMSAMPSMGGGAMMKKGGKVTKYQNAPAPIKKRTPMQELKAKYPSADTTAAGDTRFQEFNAYAPKKELKKIADTDKAFDKKYGKGKPAKNKMGGVTKKVKISAKMSKKK